MQSLQCSAADSERDRSHARANGAAAAVCTACSLGCEPPIRMPCETEAASAPPPTCTNNRSNSNSANSQPRVRPPSRHHAFSVPCTLNGIAPAATASRKRCTHGSPGGSPGIRGHSTTVAPSCTNRFVTWRFAEGGTKTRIGHETAVASVAAASAAFPHEAIASGGRCDHSARPICSAARRCSRIVNR